MSYKIVFSPGAGKQYNKIKATNKSLTRKVQKAFNILSQNPYSGKFLTGELKGYHSYRIGNHRILYKIIHEQVVIVVVKIEKRGSVYI